MRRSTSPGLAAVTLAIAALAAAGCGLHRQPPPTVPLSEAAAEQMAPILAPWRGTLGRPRPTKIILGQKPEAEQPRDRLVIISCETNLRYVIRSPWAMPGGALVVGLCDGTTQLTPVMVAAAQAALDATATPRPEDIGSGLEADYLPLVLAGDGTQELSTLIVRRSRCGRVLVLQLDKEDFCRPDINHPSLLCTNPKQVLIDLARGLAAYL